MGQDSQYWRANFSYFEQKFHGLVSILDFVQEKKSSM